MSRLNPGITAASLFVVVATTCLVGTRSTLAQGGCGNPTTSRATGDWAAYVWDSCYGLLHQTASVAPAGAVAGFPLQSNKTALLTTTSLTGLVGNLTGKTLTASVSLASTGSIVYGLQNGSKCPSVPAHMRLFISTDSHTYSPTKAGHNETGYWWSNPVNVPMNTPISGAPISVPLTPGNWSDANGHLSSDPAYTPGFNAAVANVRQVGVSFGGGCFFDTGIGVASGSGSFALNSIAAQ